MTRPTGHPSSILITRLQTRLNSIRVSHTNIRRNYMSPRLTRRLITTRSLTKINRRVRGRIRLNDHRFRHSPNSRAFTHRQIRLSLPRAGNLELHLQPTHPPSRHLRPHRSFTQARKLNSMIIYPRFRSRSAISLIIAYNTRRRQNPILVNPRPPTSLSTIRPKRTSIRRSTKKPRLQRH